MLNFASTADDMFQPVSLWTATRRVTKSERGPWQLRALSRTNVAHCLHNSTAAASSCHPLPTA